MAAATADNSTSPRQPGDLVAYTGVSGSVYYKGTAVMKGGSGMFGIIPVVQGAGASNGRFQGVVDNRVDLTSGLGASQGVINVWKNGVFTFNSNGTGVSADIGQRVYFLDNQTVGLSIAVPCIYAGDVVAVPDTNHYRVWINGAVGYFNSQQLTAGISGFSAQN